MPLEGSKTSATGTRALNEGATLLPGESNMEPNKRAQQEMFVFKWVVGRFFARHVPAESPLVGGSDQIEELCPS